jgi:hypothetical protein
MPEKVYTNHKVSALGSNVDREVHGGGVRIPGENNFLNLVTRYQGVDAGMVYIGTGYGVRIPKGRKKPSRLTAGHRSRKGLTIRTCYAASWARCPRVYTTIQREDSQLLLVLFLEAGYSKTGHATRLPPELSWGENPLAQFRSGH